MKKNDTAASISLFCCSKRLFVLSVMLAACSNLSARSNIECDEEVFLSKCVMTETILAFVGENFKYWPDLENMYWDIENRGCGYLVRIIEDIERFSTVYMFDIGVHGITRVSSGGTVVFTTQEGGGVRVPQSEPYPLIQADEGSLVDDMCRD